MPSYASIRYGGDYNPEHWPSGVIDEDLALMKDAGVNLVSLGIFGWAEVERTPGTYDFSYYRMVLDRLHAAGIGVSMATMTASPPPWMAHRHPEVLPETADGTKLWPGGRQHYCPSSPVYRSAARSLVRALVQELGDHPAITLWHINNEFACHIRGCWCDVSAASFRRWLQERYGSVDGLNAAWTTTFWSQRYSDFAEVLPPRIAPSFPNNAQQLDFLRFNSQEIQSLLTAEITELRAGRPEIPVTTNFAGVMPALDLWAWAEQLDVVAFDSYPDPADPDAFRSAAFDYAVIRGVGGGAPWLLMEQAPSAVNWRRTNAPKPAGRMRVGSWQAVAHGADAVMFFQWRASPGGAEKFHSAMVGHTGGVGRVFDEVSELGGELAGTGAVVGSRTDNEAALLLDWDSWWAGELDSHPTGELTLRQQMLDWYGPAMDAALPLDVVRPDGALENHRLLIAPSLYLVTEQAADRLTAWVEAGGVLVLTYFSGVVDARDRIHPGGAPGPLRDLVGATVQEWWPLPAGEEIGVDSQADSDADSDADRHALSLPDCRTRTFAEDLTVHSAEVLARYRDGELAGKPAILRNRVGAGTVFYVGTRLDDRGVRSVLELAMARARTAPLVTGLPAGVEIVPRGTGAERRLFLLNHTREPQQVRLPVVMQDELAPTSAASDTVRLERFGVAIMR